MVLEVSQIFRLEPSLVTVRHHKFNHDFPSLVAGAAFWGANGLEATAPVMSAPEYAKYLQLPSPLGQVQ